MTLTAFTGDDNEYSSSMTPTALHRSYRYSLQLRSTSVNHSLLTIRKIPLQTLANDTKYREDRVQGYDEARRVRGTDGSPQSFLLLN